MSIGKLISDLIQLNDTNVNELAKRIDISPQTIYSIIKRNNKKIDMDTLSKISKALGVSIDYFYNGQTGAGKKHIVLSLEEQEVIRAYRNLNPLGRSEVKKRLEELSYFDKYTTLNDTYPQLPQSAHEEKMALSNKGCQDGKKSE